MKVISTTCGASWWARSSTLLDYVSIRAMLARVQQLEQSRSSPWLRLIDPVEEFDAYIRDGIALGQLDPTDAPTVLASMQRWVREADKGHVSPNVSQTPSS